MRAEVALNDRCSVEQPNEGNTYERTGYVNEVADKPKTSSKPNSTPTYLTIDDYCPAK